VPIPMRLTSVPPRVIVVAAIASAQ
jgi:hypothetical protein